MNEGTQRLSRDSLELFSDFAAPTSATEEKLVSIWADIFEIDGLGIDDDFFDLGGNSVNATRLTAEITKTFGVKYMTGQIVENPTIRELATAIDSKAVRALPSHVQVLHKGGNRPPLFIVHGLAGFLFPSAEYLSAFHDDQPVYGFQVPGFDGEMEPLRRVEDIADLYLQSMLTINPDGPWHIAGMCSGSWIVFEIARRLGQMGKPLGRIILIDPYIERGRMREQHEMRRHAEARGPIAFVSSALSRLRLARIRRAHKKKVYQATGHWISETDEQALDIPEVREWILKRRREQEKFGQDGRTERYANEDMLTQNKSEEALFASERLKQAFHSYATEDSIDNHVDIIASEFLERKLHHPLHPVRLSMPNHSVIVAGKRHLDTVSTSTTLNSEIMQRLMDEDLPVHAVH